MEFPPFQASSDSFAMGILCDNMAKVRDEIMAQQQRIQNASWKEALGLRLQLSEYQQQKNKENSLLGQGGVASLMVQINWRDFTDKEIVDSFKKWVSENRHRSLPEPSKRGKNKAVDRRAMLESLALWRIRSRYTFNRARAYLSTLPRTAKTTNCGECNREAKKAASYFQSLFHSLNLDEKPCSKPLM